MAEYIEKQEAIEAVNRALDRETLLYSFVRNVAVSALKFIPAADVIRPVVRCKDCKHYKFFTGTGKGVCKELYGFGRWWKPDDFCSYGKRKE